MGCDINPCLNGGTCHLDSNRLATCQCMPEYTGTLCDTPKTICIKANPCQNDGFCIPKGTKDYSCLCTRKISF